MYFGKYYIEQAITDAAKAAYIATLIENNQMKIERYDNDIQYLEIMPGLTNKLNKLKVSGPEAFFYWCKTSELLL